MELLKFEFSSIKNNIKNMNYKVYTDSPKFMTLFTRQHGFNEIPKEAITVISKPSFSFSDEQYMLRPYKFKSNKNNTKYTVISTQRFIDAALEKAGNLLGTNCIFGEAIMRQDIEVFKNMASLINKLRFARVVDFLIADDEDVKQLEENQLLFRDEYELENKGKSKCDASYESNISNVIIQDLFDACDESEILPITLECYISNFTDMMCDSFD